MGKISITPQMLRTAIRELQKYKLFVKSKDLRDYLRRHYPVEKDLQALEQELQENLRYAVCVGLIAKHDEDQYCIPTLREEAYVAKTAFTAFWEIHKNNNQLRNTRKKENNTIYMNITPKKGYPNSFKSDKIDNNENFDFFL